jgi:hypothetical protein
MLLQYALNELDATRRDEIDGLLITDPEFSAAMQEAEYDLLDAYAARELSETDRGRVERALNPAGRFSLEAPGHVIRPSAPIRIAATPRPASNRRWIYLVAMAAALVLTAIITTSWRRSRHVAQPSVAQRVETPIVPPSPQPAAPPAAAAEFRPQAATIATVLLPPALRSQDALSLTLAQPATMVRFVWPASPVQPSAGGYELQVVGDDGKQSCRSTITHRETAATLHFHCAAAAIPSGTSFVRVLALPSTPDAAPLLEVTLSVARK